jgi:hypothetical protein
MKGFGLAVIGVFVCACASGDRASSPQASSEGSSQASAKAGDGGGSLWDQLDRARKEKRTRGTPQTHSESAAKSLPPGWRQNIDAWWALYLKADPGWPDARARWLELPDPAPTILVENLLRAYVVAWEGGQRSEFERARDELIAIPEHSVQVLVIGLAGGAGDSVVRNLSTDLLAAAGEVAVPPIERAWNGATSKGKWELVRALRKMRQPAAVPLLARVAVSREAFEPRIEALQGLGEIKDPAGYDAVAKCLSDQDRSVRKFAAQAIGKFGRPEAIPLLRSTLAQAQARGETDVAEEATASLRTLGGAP